MGLISVYTIPYTLVTTFTLPAGNVFFISSSLGITITNLIGCSPFYTLQFYGWDSTTSILWRFSSDSAYAPTSIALYGGEFGSTHTQLPPVEETTYVQPLIYQLLFTLCFMLQILLSVFFSASSHWPIQSCYWYTLHLCYG